MATPLSPTLRRQRQAEIFKFKASLSSKKSSSPSRATQREPVYKTTNKTKRNAEIVPRLRVLLALAGESGFNSQQPHGSYNYL